MLRLVSAYACEQVTEETLLSAFGRLITPHSRLNYVQLDFCGRCLSDVALERLEHLSTLNSLRLSGCYRVSNNAIDRLLRARGPGLKMLHFSGNSQLGEEAVTAIACNCRHLSMLALEDCAQLTAEAVLPLKSVGRSLVSLSLAGLCLLSDDTLIKLVTSVGAQLESLNLRGCAILGTPGVCAVAESCPRLRVLCISRLHHVPSLHQTTTKLLPTPQGLV